MFNEFSISSISSELMSDTSERFPDIDTHGRGVGEGIGGKDVKIAATADFF